jgi:hypothetical protein
MISSTSLERLCMEVTLLMIGTEGQITLTLLFTLSKNYWQTML